MSRCTYHGGSSGRENPYPPTTPLWCFLKGSLNSVNLSLADSFDSGRCSFTTESVHAPAHPNTQTTRSAPIVRSHCRAHIDGQDCSPV
jgi:hypothetical protein